jgi:hypothetical protein
MAGYPAPESGAPSESGATAASGAETYNPWSVVNLVFHHLAREGLHPVLGEAGDPGGPAAELLKALGITPAAEGNRQHVQTVRSELERLRAAFFGPE